MQHRKTDMVGGSKNWNLENYRINNAKEKSFPLTLGQAPSVYRRIIRFETVRTKVATEASCEYVQFCLSIV